MAPPKYDDLGKTASDLFKKGFEHGNIKCEIKSKANNNDFITKGTHNLDKKSVTAEVEHSIKNICEGVDYKHTFKTSGVTDWELNKLIKNAGKCTVSGSLSNDGYSNMNINKIKQNYTKNNLNVNLTSSFATKPLVNLDAVYNFDKINAGFSVGYDVGKSELKSSSLGASYTQGNLEITGKTQCLKNEYNLLILNKAASDRTLAAQINYSGKISMALAGKFTGCKHGTSQIKVDQDGILSNSFTTKLFGGCDATFSANMDLKNLQGGGKFGAMFKFNL